jgi:tetratricopeptide (TPR) repeat protein
MPKIDVSEFVTDHPVTAPVTDPAKVDTAGTSGGHCASQVRPCSGVEALKPAIPYELGTPHELLSLYLRGLAYLQQHSGREAEAESERLLEHRAVAPNSPYVALARLGLARAYAQIGDFEQSRKTYEGLFALWKNADANVPVLAEAKVEYAKLKRPAP